MSQNPYQPSQTYAQVVENASVSDRVQFIRNTYAHLTAAILAFVLLEAMVFAFFGDRLEGVVLAIQGPTWLLVLLAFMGVSFIADRWARSDTSRGMQYLGLSLYVVAEVILFVPLLYIANRFAPGTLQSAGIVTAIVFGGLTATVFLTKADFSFLRMALVIGSCAAFALIVLGLLFGFNSLLGFWFSFAMVILASGCILYSTSNILHHYRTDQHVAASLALFASVALLFWYVVQMFMHGD